MSYIPCFDFFFFSFLTCLTVTAALLPFLFVLSCYFYNSFNWEMWEKMVVSVKVVFWSRKNVCVFLFFCLYNSIYLLVLGEPGSFQKSGQTISFIHSLSFRATIFLSSFTVWGILRWRERVRIQGLIFRLKFCLKSIEHFVLQLIFNHFKKFLHQKFSKKN